MSERKPMNIMVLGGHPADVFDHCGGTLAHHTRKGDKVTCVALTQGLRIHDAVVSEVFRFGIGDYTNEEIERICAEREQVKLNEVKEACALFGVTDVRSLRYDDKFLLVTEELIDAVAKMIREVKPELLITHYPRTNGNTMDHHGNTGKIAVAAVMLAGTVDFEDQNPAWRVADMAFMLNPGDVMVFEALNNGTQAAPNYFVDVTDVAELKVKALDIMRSQQYDGNYARKNVETWSGCFGYNVRNSYCEGFVLNRPVVADTLEVCEHWRKRANEPEKERMDRDYMMVAPFVPRQP